MTGKYFHTVCSHEYHFIIVIVVIIINIGIMFVFEWLSGTQNKTGKQPVVAFFLSLNQKPTIYMNLADRAGLGKASDERKF